MSIRLYVGNLPKEMERDELATLFASVDESAATKVITDRKTGKCRGFGFVTVQTDEQADLLIEKFNGYLFNESELKVEKANPRSGKSEDAPETEPGNSSRRKSTKDSKRSPSGESATAAAKPDPRWAQDLEKLKDLLAAQTANS